MFQFQKGFITTFCCILMAFLLFSGCSRESEKYSLSHKRLGVYLATEKGDRIVLSNVLTDYLQHQLPDTEIIELTANEVDSAGSHPRWDYLLSARLSDILIQVSGPGLELSKKNLNIQVNYQCQLNFNYRVTDSKTGKVVLSGQSPGKATDASGVRVKEGHVDIKLDGNNQTSMVEAAMCNAVDASRILK